MTDSTQLARVGPIRGALSAILVVVVLTIIVSIAVHAIGWDIHYRGFVLKWQKLLMPDWAFHAIVAGGFKATFVLTLLAAAHNAVITLLCTLAAFTVSLAVATYRRGLARMRDPLPPLSDPFGRLGFIAKVLHLGWVGQIDAAAPDLPKEAQDHAQDVLHAEVPIFRLQIEHSTPPVVKLFPRYHMRLHRDRNVLIKRPLQTEIHHLEHALLRILHAHKDWTCDPHGHHTTQTLLPHSLAVAERLERTMNAPGLPPEPLAYSVGLAHDLGKILAYVLDRPERGDPQWRKRSARHTVLSAQIVRLLPEYARLKEHDRRTMNLVLTYMHYPERRPTNMGDLREARLIQGLRVIDGLETAADRKRTPSAADEAKLLPQLAPYIRTALHEMNINQSLAPDKIADGWTKSLYPYVIIQANSLRVLLKAKIPHTLAAALGFNARDKAGLEDPATKAIAKVLFQSDLLMDEFRKGERARLGLYKVKVGTLLFQPCFILEAQPLRKMIPDAALRWGNAKYNVKVEGPVELAVDPQGAGGGAPAAAAAPSS